MILPFTKEQEIEKPAIKKFADLDDVYGFMNELMATLKYNKDEIDLAVDNFKTCIEMEIEKRRRQFIATFQVSEVKLKEGVTDSDIIQILKTLDTAGMVSFPNTNSNEENRVVAVIDGSVKLYLYGRSVVVNGEDVSVKALNLLIELLKEVADNEVLLMCVNYNNYEYAYRIKDGETKRLEKVYIDPSNSAD